MIISVLATNLTASEICVRDTRTNPGGTPRAVESALNDSPLCATRYALSLCLSLTGPVVPLTHFILVLFCRISLSLFLFSVRLHTSRSLFFFSRSYFLFIFRFFSFLYSHDIFPRGRIKPYRNIILFSFSPAARGVSRVLSITKRSRLARGQGWQPCTKPREGRAKGQEPLVPIQFLIVRCNNAPTSPPPTTPPKPRPVFVSLVHTRFTLDLPPCYRKPWRRNCT